MLRIIIIIIIVIITVFSFRAYLAYFSILSPSFFPLYIFSLDIYQTFSTSFTSHLSLLFILPVIYLLLCLWHGDHCFFISELQQEACHSPSVLFSHNYSFSFPLKFHWFHISFLLFMLRRVFFVGVLLLFVFGLCARLPNINTDAYFFSFSSSFQAVLLVVVFTILIILANHIYFFGYCTCTSYSIIFLPLSFPHLSRAPNYFAVSSSSQYKFQNWNLASNDLNQSYFT